MDEQASDRVVTAAYTYEERDHTRLLTGALWLHGDGPVASRRSLVRKAFGGVVLGGLALAAVTAHGLGAFGGRPRTGPGSLMIAVTPLALIVFICGWIAYGQTLGLRALIRRTYRESPARGQRMVYDVDGRGLARRSPDEAFERWDEIRRVVVTAEGYLLFGPDRVDWLPHRAFDGVSQAVAAADLIRAAVADYRVVRDDPAHTASL